jgi:hypothetical protein
MERWKGGEVGRVESKKVGQWVGKWKCVNV